MGDAKSIQFQDIYHDNSKDSGVLKLAPRGLGWRVPGSDKVVTVSSEEFKKMQWLRVARNYQLRIHLKNGNIKTFDGFDKEEHDELKELIKVNYKLTLDTKELSVKGWNWGTADFEGANLVFNVSNRTMFEVPLHQVASAALSQKNEVSMTFVVSDQAESTADKKSRKNAMHELMDMRFYIPGTMPVKGEEEVRAEEQRSEGEEEPEEQSAAAALVESIRAKAELGQTGEGIVSFPDVLLLTPRGRFEISMFQDFLRLRGKTYDYKIPYSTVIKLFLLPKPDEIHIMFVMGLDPPIRQGQTRYPFLVMQFVKEDEMQAELNFESSDIPENIKEKLESHYEAPTYEIVSTLCKTLTQRKVTVPSDFKSQYEAAAFKCSMKANEGYLYPLEKCFLFIPKPPTFIPNQDIESVTFARISSTTGGSRGFDAGGSRTFDMKFTMKSGLEYQFSSINREEHRQILDFLNTKKIKIKADVSDDGIVSYADLDEELATSDEDSGPPTKRRRGSEQMSIMDEDDESEDEDFRASSSDSDVAEEFDEDYYSADSDAEEDSSKESSKSAKAKGKEPAGKESSKSAKAKGSASKDSMKSSAKAKGKESTGKSKQKSKK